MTSSPAGGVTLPAFAKINLDLRILGVRPDGYHDLRTVFQALALHDSVTLEPRPGAFAIDCDDPAVPTDRRNLVWKAASLLWRTTHPRGGATPRGVRVRLAKRIPAEAGLGGGSADAAMTLVGLNQLWRLSLDVPTLARLAARLGADVPFFLVGGTALGLGRGDDIYPLVDLPGVHAVIVRPGFGVSTAEAYGWFDEEPKRRRQPAPRPVPAAWPAWAAGLRNDLEGPVVRHHPTIGRIRQALLEAGAVVAAMSGSGSAVFGLFERPDAARRTARDLARPGWRVVRTRTLTRAEYARRLRPVLAASRASRLH
ncbi:MAG: 4-(cytidine 5'-diphospho)-2-C-methyl-D-erythritol kinase [Vicinamibacterales bacterium]